MGLRGLLLGIAGVILALALMASGALMRITSQMEDNTGKLWLALQGVRAAEEIENKLLLHGRARRQWELTRDEVHLAEMREAEEHLRRGLSDARSSLRDSEEEKAAVEETDKLVNAYLMLVSQRMATGPENLQGDPKLIAEALKSAEGLVKINLADAERVRSETSTWNTTADVLGWIVSAALLGGVGLGLWGVLRYVYQPLLAIRNALVRFHPGTPGVAVPEAGLVEFREISREFNQLAERLERHRSVQLGFIAGIAHDLRNPLSALKLGAAAVRPDRPLPPEEKLRERFALFLRQAGRIERMVEDLLDTARIEAGNLELRPEEQDLRGLIREAVQLHQDLSPAHELVLRLPEEPVGVRCDGTRIAQVLNNLLSNAIKYSPQGGQVSVELTPSPGEAWVAVTDKGVGIPAAEQESIFEPFRRSASSRDTIPGVGLGLSVARRIIEAHGGTIQVESKPGEGSTFRFWLPRKPTGVEGTGVGERR